jgi:quinol monooxygenase YgiN
MTTTLFVEFDIKPGATEAFKQAAQALFERTQEEPGTLTYDYYLSADGSRNVNIEVFRDADAFVYHNRNAASLVPALFDCLDQVSIVVMGDANDDLWNELKDIPTVHYPHLGGITR